MNTILFVQQLDSSPARQRLEGLSAFAHEVGWNIQCQSAPLSNDSLREALDFWHPIGTVLSTNDDSTACDMNLLSPDSTVLLDCYPDGLEQYAIVSSDSAAANMCGYASDTTFRRIFREETGMTLREWRKNHLASSS